MFIPLRFIYLVAGVCSLYFAVAPLLSRFHGEESWRGIVFWLGAVSLVGAAIIRQGRRRNLLATSGSAIVLVFTTYGFARLVAFRLGLIHAGKGRLFAFQPNWFDRLRPLLDSPVLVLLLISSLAAFWASAKESRLGQRPATTS